MNKLVFSIRNNAYGFDGGNANAHGQWRALGANNNVTTHLIM